MLSAALSCQGQISAPDGAPSHRLEHEQEAAPAQPEPAAWSGVWRRKHKPTAEQPAPQQTAAQRFVCSVPELRGTAQRGARRLTRDEYLQSASATLGADVVALPAVQQAAAQIPGETVGDITQEFQNEHAYDHVFGLLATAQALAKAVVSDPALRVRVFGACAKAVDQGCVETYLAAGAKRILKRPLNDARRAQLLRTFSDAGNGEQGLELLLSRLLQAPEAVFHLALPKQQCVTAADSGGKEFQVCQDEPAHDGSFAVDAWTVAARIAYALTGHGPDDALLTAAERGELGSVEDARAHAVRLMASPAARIQLEAMLDAWLDLQRLPTPNPAVASSLGIDPSELATEARRELLDFAVYEILDRNADAHTLMTDAVGFPRSERMAKLYGSEIASGDEPVALPHGHQGLLVRVAPLLSGQLRTSPILRGVYVRKRLLCDALASPDFTAVQARTEGLTHVDPKRLSARQFTEQLTAPTECMSCHTRINPLGFPLEGYDGFGAARDVEITWNADGSQRAQHALDTHVQEANIDEGDTREVADASELVQAIANSTKYSACLAERLYTHAQLRPVVAEDACALSEIEAALRDGASVKDAWLQAVLNADTFVQRAPP
jgi:hypothetical protein